jgi:hypothetical protein
VSLDQRTSANPANRNGVLDERIRKGEDLGRDMPSRWAGGAAAQLKVVVIVGGNTLVTSQTGISYSSTPITDVPSAYDPDVTSSFIDGVGRGTLYIDGVAQTSKVLIVNDGGSGAVDFALLTSDRIVVAEPRTLTVAGNPLVTVTAYSAAFM